MLCHDASYGGIFMEQKRIANVLKFFSIVTALVGALFFLWFVPGVIAGCAQTIPGTAFLRWPGTIGMWASGLLCYLALWEFWRICTRIGRDNSFCMENARSMKHIGQLAFAAVILILVGCVYLVCVGCFWPPQAVIVFFVVFIACGFGVVCLALSRLIQNAAKLKEENELTI